LAGKISALKRASRKDIYPLSAVSGAGVAAMLKLIYSGIKAKK